MERCFFEVNNHQKTMKKLKLYILLCAAWAAFALTSCDEDPSDALREIIKEDLGYLPVIARFNLLTPPAGQVRAGVNCTFDLRFWSEGEIDRIEVWNRIGTTGEFERVNQLPYNPAFSSITRTDSLIVNYTVPANVDAGTSIRVEVRIANTGLADFPRVSGVNLTVNP
jgi:hypothetical protein